LIIFFYIETISAVDKINQIISLLKKEFPGAAPKPSRSDPLDVLIATMLSQNTTDKTSFRAFENLKNNFRDWDDVMTSAPSKVKNAIRVCGLTNQKSGSIRLMLKKLKKTRGSLSLNFIKRMTNESIYNELLQFDGVGVKTVSCVLAFGLGRDVFPVDTHIHRLANRLGIADAKTPDKTFDQLKDKIPDGKRFLLHTLLIRFGRKICRSASPICGKCRLYDLCEFEDRELFAAKSGAGPKENNFIILEHV
jgi:endonuclease-3